MTTPPKPWHSGFCGTHPHADWQREACHGGHTRTPTKADPRDWVPCACPCHQETTMTQTTTAPDPTDDTPTTDLATTIAVLAAAAERLSELATTTIPDTDWADAVRQLAALRDATHTAGQVDAALVRHIYLTGEHGKQIVDGVGQVNIARSRDRKSWDERGVARAVIDARMADTAGEAPDPWDVAEWLLEVYGVSYCRVTPLRALGLEPKAFCEDTPGSIGVQLPPRGR